MTPYGVTPHVTEMDSFGAKAAGGWSTQARHPYVGEAVSAHNRGAAPRHDP